MGSADAETTTGHERATDDDQIAEMVRGFLALQARAATEGNRPLHRGVHAKGVCVRAVFEVFDVAEGRDRALATRLAKGIYARPAAYPATVRFSNSDPNIADDARPDVRGLAFSVDLGPFGPAGTGTRQDYSLQSSPILPFNDVHALVAFTKVFTAPNQAMALASLPFREQSLFAQTMVAATEQKRQPVRPYQQLRYWSAAPFRHGSQDVVKYSAVPGLANSAHALESRNPNALRDELIRHVNEDAAMSSFEFGLQLLDADQMTYQGKRRDASFWIENAAVEWPEGQAPFHTVARLSLLPSSELRPEVCEAASIDVARNSTADSAPVGSVNRVRSYVVTASRNARLGRQHEGVDPGMRGGM